MFYWIYDYPNSQLALLFCTATVLFAWISVLLSRPIVRKILGPQPAANDLVSYFVSAYGVFYGLMLGLIAVGTFESFSQTESTVATEAAVIASLYTDVSMYPEPHRSKLQDSLRAYAESIVEKVWPDQRQGRINESIGPIVAQFYRGVLGYEPTTKAQDHLQADTLTQLNKLLELRRKRINSVTNGLPATLYHVVIIGAMLNLWLCCLFSIDRLSLHLLLVGLLAAFIGLVIFLIVAMDNPFRGEFSVGSDPFKLLLDGLMKSKSGG